MDQNDRRATPDRRVRARGGRRLVDDAGWVAFTGTISTKAGWLVRCYYHDSIAEASRKSGVNESQIQDLLRGRCDPSMSVIYRLAKGAGLHPFLLFEPVTKSGL